LEREQEEAAYRAYLAEAVRLAGKNAAVPAAAFTDGKSGEYLEVRWTDVLSGSAAPAETRTADEILEDIARRAKE